MFWEAQKAQPTTEPRKEEQARQPRFQIVKLEERIAPHSACYRYRGRHYCYKHHGRWG